MLLAPGNLRHFIPLDSDLFGPHFLCKATQLVNNARSVTFAVDILEVNANVILDLETMSKVEKSCLQVKEFEMS